MEINRESTVPLYKQIFDALQLDITSGKYERDHLLPSERLLSEQFEVDRITVRKALNLLVNIGLVEKIAGLGTRVRSFPALNKKGAGRRNVVFVLPKTGNRIDRITEPFNARLFHGIESECRIRGGCNLIYTTYGDDDDPSLIANGSEVAAIIFASRLYEGAIEQTLKAGIPAIVVNNVSPLVPSITIANIEGAYEAVRHLVELGHKDIGIIQGMAGYVSAKERYEGYVRALMEADIDLSRQVRVAGDWTFDGGFAAMKQILQMTGDPPTAVFASNDLTAYGAIEAIQEHGMQVPDDISVVGFDDLEESKFIQPHLTTVAHDIDMLAKAACQELFKVIEAGDSLNVKTVIPTRLVVRDSAAPVRRSTSSVRVP